MPLPYQVALAEKIQQFGVKAVTGREVLTTRELLDLSMAEMYDTVIRRSLNAENWQQYADNNPAAVEILDRAVKAYKEWLKEEYGTN